MSGTKKILTAGVLAAVTTTPQVNAENNNEVNGVQLKTSNLADLIVANNQSIISVGAINHGHEDGISAQTIIPVDSITYGIAGDISKTQSHIIGGAGKSFDNGYIYTTGSHAREEHHGKSLEAIGGSIGGAYISNKAIIDGNVIIHKGKDAHLSTDVEHSSTSSTNISGNTKTTTVIDTTTTTRRDFDGQTRGYANLGATFKTGKNSEVRIGAQHEFNMNNNTIANFQYNHYFNDDHSKWHISANTDKHYEAGINHTFNNSNWSVGGSVFSEDINGQSNNGGMVRFTYRLNGGKASTLRTDDTKKNTNVRMNDILSSTIHTSSQHAVKNINNLGQIATTQTTTQNTTEHKETLDALTAFKQPHFIIENGNTIRVTDHGILDMDGLENVEYVITTVGGTQIKSKTGVFTGLIDGTYTITTNAEAKNGNTGKFSPVFNAEAATVTIDTVPATPIRTPDMIKAEVEAYMATVEKNINLRGTIGSQKEYTLRLDWLPKDAIIESAIAKKFGNLTSGVAYAIINNTDKSIRMGIKNSSSPNTGNDIDLDVVINGLKYSFQIDGFIEY